MGEVESLFPCALLPDGDAARRAAERLAAAGIVATLAAPGSRYHLVPSGSVELRVPATQAARARALLAQE